MEWVDGAKVEVEVGWWVFEVLVEDSSGRYWSGGVVEG